MFISWPLLVKFLFVYFLFTLAVINVEFNLKRHFFMITKTIKLSHSVITIPWPKYSIINFLVINDHLTKSFMVRTFFSIIMKMKWMWSSLLALYRCLFMFIVLVAKTRDFLNYSFKLKDLVVSMVFLVAMLRLNVWIMCEIQSLFFVPVAFDDRSRL